MRRHRTTSRKPAKARRTTRAKRRTAPKAARNRRLSASSNTEVARLARERDEALERETATSEILRLISRSPGNLELAFRSILENATRICGAKFGTLLLREADGLRAVAMPGAPPAYVEERRRNPVIHPNATTILGRAMATKESVQIADIQDEADDTLPSGRTGAQLAKLAGARSVVAVPMVRENEVIGAVLIYRQEVKPFTIRQIELVQNFAAQPVIAIENARLLNELRQRTTDLGESLEQQTATSEVLRVIASSPNQLTPVFQSMLANATRLCEAKFGMLNLYDNGSFPLVAAHNAPESYVKHRRTHPMVIANPLHPLARVAASKQILQIPDMRAEPLYAEKDPSFIVMVEMAGARTQVIVPMLRDNELLGTITIFRQAVKPFSDKQIELVKNFATQAVIAIENTRLLNDLRQSLQEQTATAEILEVINSSPGDLAPVFDAILEKALRVCSATFGSMTSHNNGRLRRVTARGLPAAYENWRLEHPLEIPSVGYPPIMLQRLLAGEAVVHEPDLIASQAYRQGHPQARALGDLGGARSAVAVALRNDDALHGTIIIFRQEVRPFSDKEIRLLQNFAAQAVIAMENARLLNELRESYRVVQQQAGKLEAQSEELVKLNQQLEQRVADQVGEIERMSRLRRFLPPQVADLIVASGSERQLESHRREITALFCDLRGFTGFSETSDPEDVMALLSDYHAAIGEIIIKYSGTLERYAGDGVMVIFNDPVPVDNPALQAVRMALEMRDAIGTLTKQWRRLGHDIGFGIGIAHGFATLGTIGFEGRFDYAAIGMVSNVASRLCDEAKSGQILISSRVLIAVEDAIAVEPVGEFALKGIRRPLPAYNVVAAKSDH